MKFTESKGEAEKNKLNYFKYKEGINKFRLVGDVLPRYVYWKKTADQQANIPVECLSFDRTEEKFLNVEQDWFSHYFPGEKCSWAYTMQCIDWEDGQPVLKVLPLKKKMFQQIINAAKKEQFGDPTDPDTGWDCVVLREKTGPAVFNVEYTLEQLDSLEAKRPLTDEERALVAEMTPIGELIPRPTPEQQKLFIERSLIPTDEEEEHEELAE